MEITRGSPWLLAAAALVVACSSGGGGSGSSDVGAVLQLVSGDAQAGTAGEPLAAPLAVKVARRGEGVAGTTIAWAVTSGGGTATALTSTTDAQGVGAIGWTLGTIAGAQTLTATAAGLDEAPITFTATAAPDEPVRLAFRDQPTDSMSGAAIAPPIRVALEDRYGNLAAGASAAVTLVIETNPGGGSLAGTTQVLTSGGVATFADLAIDRMGAGYRLAASAPGLPVALSDPFAVTVNLAFVDQPTETFAGAVIFPAVKLRATEAGIPLAGVSVSVGIEGSGSGVLTGGAQASTGADGTVQFAELRVDDRGAGYRLVATGRPAAGPVGVGRSAAFDVLEVDQQQPGMDQTIGGLVIGGASEQILAQVVTAAVSGDLVGVRMPVQCSRGTLVVSIRRVTGFEPDEVILASRSFYAAEVRASYPTLDAYPVLRPEAPVPLAAGERFAIVLESSGDCGLWQGPVGDAYPGGDAFYDARPNTAGVWILLTGPAYDLPFQTVMR